MTDAYHPFTSNLVARPDSDLAKAKSAALYGTLNLGRSVHLAQGAVIRSLLAGVTIGEHSMVLENSIVVGHSESPTRIGGKVVFGHRTTVIGATVGDLCEIGNNSIIMSGAKIGEWCILGEGTLIAEGEVIPCRSVVVGRPGRVIRSLTAADQTMIVRMRGGDVALSQTEQQLVHGVMTGGPTMGKLYSYQGKSPQVAETAFLFDSAEITGDVSIGEGCIIGAGVKIIGDSHGPVRIGNDVQILENTVLHLLPDNRLIIADNVIIGPCCMIHGCEIGAGTLVEPGAILCDYSKLGKHVLVKAGALVKQRSQFPDYAVLDGFPAKQIAISPTPPAFPTWALTLNDLRSLTALLS
jgi:carbonic anhydrase/acetyltransferase-like protein (isoleucine patch superfamily)